MGDIYTERGLTETPTVNIGEMSTGSDVRRAGKVFDAIEDYAQQKAEKYQNLANKLYVNGSNLAINDELQRLSNDPAYASNPQAFAKEADKVASKIYGDIQNPELKADVIMHYELSKSPYINRAYSNMYRKQNEELEYQTLSDIQKNMDRTGISIENIMNGDFGVDDIRTLSEAKGNLDKYLSAKDVRGFNMFTPGQRVQMERVFNNGVVERLKGGYLQLDVHERQGIIDMLKNDEFLVNRADKDGFVASGDIKSMLPTDSYLDFKDFVLKSHARALKKAGSSDEITPEMQALADRQMMNSIVIESEMKTIQDLKREKPSERILHNLELMDSIDGIDEDGLTKSDRKRYKKETLSDLIESVKNPASVFDETGRDSAFSTALQMMKNDGKMEGSDWANEMSVVTLRDYYAMAKEQGLEFRAYDSSSRDKSKSIMSKAIQDTQERYAGGYGKDYNSVFINGVKVSRRPVERKNTLTSSTDNFYTINNGKKTYTDTKIEVDL